jgi:hypothetical protein
MYAPLDLRLVKDSLALFAFYQLALATPTLVKGSTFLPKVSPVDFRMAMHFFLRSDSRQTPNPSGHPNRQEKQLWTKIML